MKQLKFLKLTLAVALLASSLHINAGTLQDRNKTIVKDFYEGVFVKHEVEKYSDKHIGDVYIQHNPYVTDGKKPFVDYFKQYFIDNPQAKNEIKRILADKDLVVLHVHSRENISDRGQAVVDIFRVRGGKIVEHWDVIQDVPEKAINKNTMF